ncbi:hypothetical protein VPH35_027795 [Triticum aestivum]
MESTLITRLSPLLPSPSKPRPLSSSPLAGARRIASISFSSGSVCGVLRPRGGVTSSVTAAAAALGEAAEAGSEAILLNVQGMMCDGCAASVKRILESQVVRLSFTYSLFISLGKLCLTKPMDSSAQ